MFNVPKIVTINTGDQKVNFDKIPPYTPNGQKGQKVPTLRTH